MPRQIRIPGTEAKQNKALNAAAEAYVTARDERMAKTEVEVDAKEALIREMKKADVTTYRDDEATPPLIVTLVPGKDQVKVTEQASESEGDDDEETPRPRRGRSAAAASSDPLEAEADRILANAGDGKLNDPKLKGKAERHRKAKTRTANEVGATST